MKREDMLRTNCLPFFFQKLACSVHAKRSTARRNSEVGVRVTQVRVGVGVRVGAALRVPGTSRDRWVAQEQPMNEGKVSLQVLLLLAQSTHRVKERRDLQVRRLQQTQIDMEHPVEEDARPTHDVRCIISEQVEAEAVEGEVCSRSGIDESQGAVLQPAQARTHKTAERRTTSRHCEGNANNTCR